MIAPSPVHPVLQKKACYFTRRTGMQFCMMKLTTWWGLLAAGILVFSGVAQAGSTKTYQVTGPVLEMNDSMIVVQKGKERWEIARNTDTKMKGDVKVGSKVTVMYTMTATEVEAKGAKGKK
jgi:hypothetical protein